MLMRCDSVVFLYASNIGNTAGASVLEPVVKKKDIKKYQKMALRSVPVEMK